jgi:hypothetical protein
MSESYYRGRADATADVVAIGMSDLVLYHGGCRDGLIF